LLSKKKIRYYLQLKIGDDWKDWVYIDKSKTGHEEYGLFAAVDFPMGTIIGCYVGSKVWTSNLVGGSMPSYEKLKKANVPVSNPLALTYRDNKARMVTVVPSRFSDVTEAVPLYMGMQFVNYAGQDQQNNIIIIDDGSIETVQDIFAGTELCTTFKSVETDDEQEQQKQPVDTDDKQEEQKQPALRKKRVSKKRKQSIL
jgi:hypothetical protein